MIETMAELERVRSDCRALVTKRSLMSAGAAVVPIPGVELVADIGLLTTLLPQISAQFGLAHDQIEKLEPHRAQQVMVIAADLGNGFIGRLVTRKLVTVVLRRIGMRVAAASLAKFVPIVGSAVAAGVSFGAMKLVGNAHVEDCYRAARALIEAPRPPG